MIEDTFQRRHANFIIRSGFTSRALLDYRLSGGAEFLINLLAEYRNTTIADFDQEKCSCPRKFEELHTKTLELLEILGVCCHDGDFSTDFASYGGHAILKKLLADGSVSSELTEEVENIICAITLSGNKFPSRTISSHSSSVIVQPTKFKFSERPNLQEDVDDDKNVTRCEHGALTVYLRSIPASIHGTGQHTVGYLLWSSAVILSRFIIQNESKIVRDRVVLECGAGLGLCGIVAGRYASRVTVTDFSEILVQNLDYNIRINQGLELIDGEKAAVRKSCTMDACPLDWNLLEDVVDTSYTAPSHFLQRVISTGSTCDTECEKANCSDSKDECAHSELIEGMQSKDIVTGISRICDRYPDGNKYDIIIGSDLVYCQKDAVGIVKVLSKHLSSSGIFVIVVPGPSHRYGTEFLSPMLQEGGFDVYVRCIAHTNYRRTYDESRGKDGHDSGSKSFFQDKLWLSSATSDFVHSNHDDGYLMENTNFGSFLHDLHIDEDFLVSELDEQDIVSWLMLVGHRSVVPFK